MKRFAVPLFTFALAAANTKLQLRDLPEPVQNAVKQNTGQATIASISKEVEHGKTLYEVETLVGGKTRDLLLTGSGKVLSIEEETGLASIPAAARTAFEKRAAGGTVRKVEKVTSGNSVSYEAELQLKSGKKVEAAFNADGSVHK